MDRLKESVNERFGYGHLPKRFIESNNIDLDALVNENGWEMIDGTLTVSFHKSKMTTVDWSAIKNQKQLKQVAKEIKKRSK